MATTIDSTYSSIPDEYKYKQDTTTTKSNSMDKNAFLNLLVTQLRYQDPLSPTDDKEFVAQMAQFTSLEQMQNLNQSSQMSQGYNLIGKNVVGEFKNVQTGETEEVTGTAQAVKLTSGTVYVVVDGKDIELSKISTVYNPTADTSNKDLLTEVKSMNKTITELKEQITKLTGSSTVTEN